MPVGLSGAAPLLIGMLTVLGLAGLALVIVSGVLLIRGGKEEKIITEQTRSVQTSLIKDLQPGMETVTLRGHIEKIHEPINPAAPVAQAMLRLRVEALEENLANGRMEWKARSDRIMVSPFLLKDESGEVWVDARQIEKYRLTGDSFEPSKSQIQEAMRLLDIPAEVTEGWRLRYRLWELQQNQMVTVIGSVLQAEDQIYIGKTEGQPLIVTPLEPKGVKVKVEKTIRHPPNWTLIIGLGMPGLVLLCLAWLVTAGLIYQWSLIR